jgi:hypothetical protein
MASEVGEVLERPVRRKSRGTFGAVPPPDLRVGSFLREDPSVSEWDGGLPGRDAMGLVALHSDDSTEHLIEGLEEALQAALFMES